MVGPLVLHTMPCQQMPTPWARGIPPGVSSTFHVLARCRGHGKPEFSTPPLHPLILIHAVWPLARGSTGSKVCTVWARAQSGHGQQAAWQLPPGPSENCIRKVGKVHFQAQPLSLRAVDHPEIGGQPSLLHGSGERSDVHGSQHLRSFSSFLEKKNPTRGLKGERRGP